MMITYPAVFHKNEDGSYHVTFPDLGECYADGATVDEAIDAAIDMERAWIMARLEESEDLPLVSSIEDIAVGENEEVRKIGAIIKLMDGWEE